MIYDKIEDQEEIKELRLLQEEVEDILMLETPEIEQMFSEDPENVIKLMRSGFRMLSGFIEVYVDAIKKRNPDLMDDEF